MPGFVQQVKRSLGDMQLVHRINHGAVCARTLGLTDACRLFEGGRRGTERFVDMPGHLLSDSQKQTAAQEREYQCEDAGVPHREVEAQPHERGQGATRHGPNR